MVRDWESTFRNWASPPGKTEQERCENAIRAIKNAITRSPQLNQREIKVFTHGSYRNNTNVRQDSDVDIGILCTDTFFYEYFGDYDGSDFQITPSTYHYSQFKNEVGQALVDYFGAVSVKRGNKAFDIKENSYHVDADVAAFFEHRRYYYRSNIDSGIQLFTDDGKKIINWPEQHYTNGVSKNYTTGKRYKAMVRILKKLCNEMTDNGIDTARPIPGFLNECLVWNVPNSEFQNSTYMANVRTALAFLFNNTRSHEDCKKWVEVSELIYLFHSGQKWTRLQTNSFILAAWNHIGFK